MKRCCYHIATLRKGNFTCLYAFHMLHWYLKHHCKTLNVYNVQLQRPSLTLFYKQLGLEWNDKNFFPLQSNLKTAPSVLFVTVWSLLLKEGSQQEMSSPRFYSFGSEVAIPREQVSKIRSMWTDPIIFRYAEVLGFRLSLERKQYPSVWL